MNLWILVDEQKFSSEESIYSQKDFEGATSSENAKEITNNVYTTPKFAGLTYIPSKIMSYSCSSSSLYLLRLTIILSLTLLKTIFL